MPVNYTRELDTIVAAMKSGYEAYSRLNAETVRDKAAFDLVTAVDESIEKYITKVILEHFPTDTILGEEFSSDAAVHGRTWTIDPIDGTYNFANQIPLFGIQCSLFDRQEIVVSAIYLPTFGELYTATKGGGAYRNGVKLRVDPEPLDHCVVSLGDFPHSRPGDIAEQKRLVRHLSDRVARIRMFGAACMDFAWLASGRANGTVIFTKNKWDLAPGILLAREAGAVVKAPDGDYSFDARAVIATASEELYFCIKEGIEST